MPSGKKKRKAAKKKQENQSNNHHPSSSSAQTHEGDEVSSPASQDHHSNQNNLTEEEEEEIDEGDDVSNHPSVEGVKIVDKPSNAVVEENFVPIEREFKIDDESDKKDYGGFEHDETASKSYDGGSSGDSSSSNNSSDDESHEIKNSQAVVENIPAVISEVDLSFAANNSMAPSIVESEFKENGEKKPSSDEDKVGISNTTECVSQEIDDRSSLSYNPTISSVNNGADQEKDSGISEPLLAPAPQPVQTTSWKSCCGLFEVFAGSGR